MKKNETKERRGSIIDLFLFFLILLSVIGFFLRMYELKRTKEQIDEKSFLISVSVEKLETPIASCLQPGDIFYGESGELIGELDSMEFFSSEVEMIYGGVHYSGTWDRDLYCDVKLVFSVRGYESDGHMFANAIGALLVGKTVTVCSNRVILTVTLDSFVEINGEYTI